MSQPESVCPMELLDLISVTKQMLVSLRDAKAGRIVHCVETFVRDFEAPMQSTVTALQSCRPKREDSSRNEDSSRHEDDFELRNAAEVIATDTLGRMESLRADAATCAGVREAELFDRMWPGETMAILEERIRWLLLKIHSVQKGSNTDSRTLRTGPIPDLAVRSEHTEPSGEPPSEATSTTVELNESISRTLVDLDRTEIVQEFMLERLKFANMKDRDEGISHAHAATFEWIFRDEASNALRDTENFVTWLKRADKSQLYWINGKAGSGKSTLMRFVAEHKLTAKYLERWQGDVRLHILTFFFWTSGSSLQRSQAGLFRSLLFQLLEQRKEIIPWAFPEVWMASQETKQRINQNSFWSRAELFQGLSRALAFATKDARLCIFIDGLDEFDGSEATIIRLVRDIVRISPHIKICTSSRPWAAFETAFQDIPHLRLEDLTEKDMRDYISHSLERRNHLRDAAQDHLGDLENFKKEVVLKAQGVFLWTTLGLRTVLKSIQPGTTANDMRLLLAQLPSDLDDLFAHLLSREMSEDALCRQSHAFQIIRAQDIVCNFTGDDSARAITLYQMALAHAGRLDDLGMFIRQANTRTVLEMCHNCVALLRDECAGLLTVIGHDNLRERYHPDIYDRNKGNSVHTEANRRIQYLHRTVRDFMEHSSAWAQIVENGDRAFDPHQGLLMAYVLRLQSPLQAVEKHRRLDEWWHEDIVPAMTHARYAASATASTSAFLLDKLNETLEMSWRKKTSDEQDHWARNAFGTYEERMKHRSSFYHPFISLAAKFGLADYIRIKLGQGNISFPAGIPPLTHALEFLFDRRRTVYPLCSVDTIAALLENHQPPNQIYRDMGNTMQTPWLMALRYLREAQRRGWIQPYDVNPDGLQRSVTILDLMIDSGADCDAVVVKDQWDPEATAQGIISSVAETYFSSSVWNLSRKVLDRAKASSAGI